MTNFDNLEMIAKLKRIGVSGLAAGFLAMLMCELPLVLAIIGVGGLGVGGAWFNPDYVEVIGFASFLVGGLALLAMFAIKRRKRGC